MHSCTMPSIQDKMNSANRRGVYASAAGGRQARDGEPAKWKVFPQVGLLSCFDASSWLR